MFWKMLNIALKCQWYTYPICQNEFFKGKGWILDSSVSEVPPLTWFITHCFIIWWFYLVISSMKHFQQNSLSNERNFQWSILLCSLLSERRTCTWTCIKLYLGAKIHVFINVLTFGGGVCTPSTSGRVKLWNSYLCRLNLCNS